MSKARGRRNVIAYRLQIPVVKSSWVVGFIVKTRIFVLLLLFRLDLPLTRNCDQTV